MFGQISTQSEIKDEESEKPVPKAIPQVLDIAEKSDLESDKPKPKQILDNDYKPKKAALSERPVEPEDNEESDVDNVDGESDIDGSVRFL